MIKLLAYYTIFEEKVTFGHWGDRKRAPRTQNAPHPQCYGKDPVHPISIFCLLSTVDF